MEMMEYRENENLCFEEYYDFLKRSDLGGQYPKERFEERIRKLLTTRSVAITARNDEGKLVGIAFGVTDFSYFLFITDLGVDRAYVKQGIGSELLILIREAVGGEDDITVVTVAHETAIGFYEKCEYVSEKRLFWKPCNLWSKIEVI
ncbi:MAG: GNAT family N-acetyltransferase [Drouetiella hepatica Uher 2000/2452]|jgi:ribosomal protein S18 acetylase RimI-like enzyme|uniref:GNAT family N-acetyltransferase n=1 Tax=Drouetiella hepatica Uher 2000/2452 TaxID=904376 RepID=A0A951QEF7_9CYAN|nr:GNAT family N-acetyltransferase [Drouetiella hepatica Uher 2000/2452]